MNTVKMRDRNGSTDFMVRTPKSKMNKIADVMAQEKNYINLCRFMATEHKGQRNVEHLDYLGDLLPTIRAELLLVSKEVKDIYLGYLLATAEALVWLIAENLDEPAAERNANEDK